LTIFQKIWFFFLQFQNKVIKKKKKFKFKKFKNSEKKNLILKFDAYINGNDYKFLPILFEISKFIPFNLEVKTIYERVKNFYYRSEKVFFLFFLFFFIFFIFFFF
jgi:hypothetical protein